MENLKQLQERVAVSDGRAKADLVIKNGRIINVFSGEIMDGDIAIKNGISLVSAIFQMQKRY